MPRILIIDQDENVRETLGVFTEMLGHEPIYAADASSCSSIHATNQNCTKEHPCADILLIDQRLESMLGLEFVEKQIQKGCKAAARCKAIMSSTFTSEEFKQANKIGCHVLQKPVTYEILENWLSSVEVENQTVLEAS